MSMGPDKFGGYLVLLLALACCCMQLVGGSRPAVEVSRPAEEVDDRPLHVGSHSWAKERRGAARRSTRHWHLGRQRQRYRRRRWADGYLGGTPSSFLEKPHLLNKHVTAHTVSSFLDNLHLKDDDDIMADSGKSNSKVEGIPPDDQLFHMEGDAPGAARMRAFLAAALNELHPSCSIDGKAAPCPASGEDVCRAAGVFCMQGVPAALMLLEGCKPDTHGGVEGEEVEGEEVEGKEVAKGPKRRLSPMFGRVTSLHVMSLIGCNIHGTVPPELGELINLVALDLSMNNLEGPLPRSIGNLTDMEFLRFHDNKLSGTFLAELCKLRKLTHLDLSKNQLQGVLPEDIGNLTGLSALFLHTNKFSGEIPWSLNKLTSMVNLDLDTNYFTCQLRSSLFESLQNLESLSLRENHFWGNIPASIGKLRHLEELYMKRNNFSGKIPPELGQLSNLRDLVLSNNFLQGGIPEQFKGLTNLKWLDLSSNGLSGLLPTGMWSHLALLEWLYLGSNGFYGPIPEELGNLFYLRHLDFMHNKLGGDIPESLGTLLWLDTLDLKDNLLGGPIPSSFSRMVSLTWLDLSDNWLTDEIPCELGDLENLEMLDLAENNLGGSIPGCISELKLLWYLGLGGNWLEGPIPRGLDKLKHLYILNLGDNALTGPIPNELGKLRHLVGLLLHRNRLVGTIPPELQKLDKLAFLVIHENGLHGSVPPIRLSQCGLKHCSKNMVLTMYGNHLSCRLPDLIDPERKQSLQGAVIHGNTFSLPMPTWLPMEADPLHFQREGKALMILAVVLLAGIVWASVVVMVLRGQTSSFVLDEVFSAHCECTSQDVVQAHVDLAYWVLIMALPISVLLLLSFFLGGNYTKCGNPISHVSVTYLARSAYSELAVACLEVLHIFSVVWYISRVGHMKISRKKAWNAVLWKALPWLGWLLAVAVVAIPPAMYAAIKAMPWDNNLRKHVGSLVYAALGRGLPAVSAVLNSLIMPRLAEIYGKRYGLEIKRLLTFMQILCVWLVPGLVVVLMDEQCLKRWRLFWTFCDHDGLNATFTLGDKSVKVLKTEDLCAMPSYERLRWQHSGSCSREVLETLIPLRFQALALEVMGFPVLYIVLWWLSEPAEDGTLKLRRLGVTTSFSKRDYLIQLEIWAATAAAWGAVVPLIQPFVLMGVLTSFVNMRLETRHFGGRIQGMASQTARERDDADGPQRRDSAVDEQHMVVSKGILRLALMLLGIFLTSFLLESYFFGLL